MTVPFAFETRAAVARRERAASAAEGNEDGEQSGSESRRIGKKEYFLPKYAVNNGKVRTFWIEPADSAHGGSVRSPRGGGHDFRRRILLVAAALSAALLASKLSERARSRPPRCSSSPRPSPPTSSPGSSVSTGPSRAVATVALIVILFDGGLSIGWRRFRAAAVPIASLGVLGTFATAGGVGAVAHWALGLDGLTAGLIGAAIAPTDPAVMFSVLGDREVGGRTARSSRASRARTTRSGSR